MNIWPVRVQDCVWHHAADSQWERESLVVTVCAVWGGTSKLHHKPVYVSYTNWQKHNETIDERSCFIYNIQLAQSLFIKHFHKKHKTPKKIK